MMPVNLCLSFAQLAGSSTALPPPNIQELLKNRISYQWSQRTEDVGQLRFDDATCAFQGSYFYTERSMVLSADSDQWRGPLEMTLTGIIEGERLPFERVSKELSVHHAAETLLLNSPQTVSASWKTWLPWTIAALGLAATTYVWIEREHHVKQLRGLVLKF
ncbi:MAG: hypothetical protein ABIO95_06665 [Bdellovibrionota bacterium]